MIAACLWLVAARASDRSTDMYTRDTLLFYENQKVRKIIIKEKNVYIYINVFKLLLRDDFLGSKIKWIC